MPRLEPPGASPPGAPPAADTVELYRSVLQGLGRREIPFLVGGGYALAHHAGIERHTRDLDIFVCRDTLPAIVDAAREMGLEAREFSSHWLWKIETDAGYVDLIYSSGNGVVPVDEAWFEHSVAGRVFGIPVRLIPAEEMIWSKAFIQERERFDGADIAHILLERADTLDWERLLARFGPHWRVLFGHLVLFGFIYPDHRHRLPQFVMRELVSRLRDETAPGASAPPASNLCGGTLLSRSQYLTELRERGYQDARLPPFGTLTPEQIEEWTRLGEEESAAAPVKSPPAGPERVGPVEPKLNTRRSS